MATFNSLRSNAKFQNTFLNELRLTLRKEGDRLDLMSYMIMPVQRIPRYVLLLKELLKYTFSTHCDHEPLHQALHKIQNTASQINDSKRAMENLSKLIEIQERVSGAYDQLIQPYRFLIREGTLTSVETSEGLFGSSSTNKVHVEVFLFSDILLWTTSSSVFKGVIDLTGSRINDVTDPLGFELITSTQHLMLLAPNMSERTNWMKDLMDAHISCQQKRTQLRARKAQLVSREKRAESAASAARESLHHTLIEQLRCLREEGGSRSQLLNASMSPPNTTTTAATEQSNSSTTSVAKSTTPLNTPPPATSPSVIPSAAPSSKQFAARVVAPRMPRDFVNSDNKTQ